MSVRSHRVQSCASVGVCDPSEKRLAAVLAAGLKQTPATEMRKRMNSEVRRLESADSESEDYRPQVDRSRISTFRIEIYAESNDNSFHAGIFCDNDKHLVLLGDLYKSAMMHALNNSSQMYKESYDRKFKINGNLRRYIHYIPELEDDRKPQPFGDFKGKVNMEELADYIKKYASSYTHEADSHKIEYFEVYQHMSKSNPDDDERVIKVIDKQELGSPPHRLAVVIKGQLTVSESFKV